MRSSRRLAALASFLALATIPAAAQQPAGWVSVRTTGYDLYAPNQALLHASRAQLDSARAEFARYFPGPTPKLHVVVADNRDELMKFDVRALRAQVGEVLAWTVATPRSGPNGSIMEMRSGAESRPSDIALFGNLSAVVADAPDGRGGAVVRFTPPSGAAAGVDLRAQDVIRAVNGRSGANARALIAAYDAIAAGAQVRLDVERDRAATTVTFAKPAGAQRAQIQNNASPGGTRPGAATGAGPTGAGGEPRILSHEAGHQLFGLYVQAKLGGREKAREAMRARLGDSREGETRVAYGSPLVADWLDEAGATLSESDATQAERRRYILDNFGSVIPLATLFGAEHPALPGLRSMAEAQRRAGTAGQQVGPISVRVQRGMDSMDPGMFYAQSLSVAEFLAEREGPAFLDRVVDATLRGRSMDEVLQTASRLPKTVAELHREWSAWVAR